MYVKNGEIGVHKWEKYISERWRKSRLPVVKPENNFQSKWDPKPPNLIYYNRLIEGLERSKYTSGS